MKENNSKRFELDIETIKRWIRATVIIFTPAIYLFLDQLTKGNIDFTAIYAAGIASIVDFARRYLTDYSKSLDK